MVTECNDAVCTGCGATTTIQGVTIVNYGTATGGAGDISAMYFQTDCGGTKSLLTTLTYAGLWGTLPTWTWAGSLSFPDACTSCGCGLSLDVFTSIAPCPVDGRTVQLGPGFNDVLNPTWPGGVQDSCGCAGPWNQAMMQIPKTIRYTTKEASASRAAPGDTVTYTIYYGRPGSVALNSEWITDSLPAYTHYTGGGAPAPDPGWAPNSGPPVALRWTINPVGATTGGPTGQITFGVSVDWGNGEGFEPGSGDVAAPEGQYLFNQIHLAWDPPSACAPGVTSNAPSLVIRRFLFFALGDNDLLFAPRYGQPDDEMIYSIFVQNVSATKTWWNVGIWDTVPATLDAWSTGYGFEDPCAGWTMTPTGCAAAAPGKVTGGGNTVLTWKMDLEPGATITLRWRARVKPTTPANSTTLNYVSLLEYGKTGIVGGTGSSVTPALFIHEAPVVLRTTYVSYVGWAGAASSFFTCVGQTYYITFYPLNKATDFALYRKWCCASAPCDVACAGFSANGGVSPSIDVFAGTCVAGPPPDWEPGCKVERIPSRYIPSQFAAGNSPAFPFNFLHKLTSNGPVIWELSMCFSGANQDASTFAGTTSLSFSGYMSYTYARVLTEPNVTDILYIANTDDTQSTALYGFDWNPATLTWDFLFSQDLYQGSQWDFVPPATNHYRVVSSATRVIVHKAYPGIGQGGAFNDFGAPSPNRENGNLINLDEPATFYLWSSNDSGTPNAIVGNVGVTTVDYGIWKYTPNNPALPPPSTSVTADLVDSAGTWSPVGANTVPPGLAAATNPRAYGNAFLSGPFAATFAFYKIVVTNGHAAVYSGRSIFDEYSGGSMVHASNVMGDQVGREFWIHEALDTKNSGCGGNDDALQTIDVFSPKINLGVNTVSSDNYSATYTTNGIDQCVSFKSISSPANGTRRNWKISVTPGGNPGDVITQWIDCEIGEKFYTAPFLRRGVYYDIIAPPVVFSGQAFWITVIVVDSGGGTKSDYCGTSSFTSTDGAAQMGGMGMDLFNFTWSSSIGACPNPPDENGVAIFLNVILADLGPQTIVGSDTADGTITGLATILVVAADVKLAKQPALTVAASGDTVNFRICWSNFSSASAFTFVITDPVPEGTDFLPEAGTAVFDCGNTKGVVPRTAYSVATSATPPAAFTEANPLAGTRWLRWTIPSIGTLTTGCVCYRVTVR